VLVEMDVVEQRYRVVLEVLEDGLPVVEVAARHGVSRQTVHNWLRRYRGGGMSRLVDHSRRPAGCPHRMPPAVEELICELRRKNPLWGPWRLVHELQRRAVEPVPGRTSVYRALERNRLIEPAARRRRRAVYRRWERARPMELWQMDVVSFQLADRASLSLLTGVDDHSRYCVCAAVLRRADSRSVCAAFSAALGRYGVPDQLLTDNGMVFTGRFTGGLHPTLVLFERICQQQGIRHLLTKPRSPTTTGKIERFHRTLRTELFATQRFSTVEEAQAAIDAYVEHYNNERPHQALGMLTPARRFAYDEAARLVEPPLSDEEIQVLVPQPSTTARATALEPLSNASLMQRKVHRQGTVGFGGAVYSIGRRFAGHLVTVAVDNGLVRFVVDNEVVRTHRVAAGGGYVRGDTKREALYRRNSHRNVEVEQTSVNDVVDLVRQA